MTTALEVFSDLSEQLRYNLPDFPLYVRQGVLRQFDGYAAACHWHPDLEFVSVLEGTMSYFVNGQIEVLSRGEGIFVNSQRLHYGFSAGVTDCAFDVVAVHPSLLSDSNSAMKPWLQEKFGLQAQDCLVLHPEPSWQADVLETLRNVCRAMEEEPQPLLRALALTALACAKTGERLEARSGSDTGDRAWMTVWKMRSFVHRNYGKDISLDDIAASGSEEAARCCARPSALLRRSP